MDNISAIIKASKFIEEQGTKEKRAAYIRSKYLAEIKIAKFELNQIERNKKAE